MYYYRQLHVSTVPYEDNDGLIKPYGFVLDFVGIFAELWKKPSPLIRTWWAA